MFRDIQFESSQLITKSLELSDAPTLLSFYSDAEAMKYRGSPPMQSKNDAVSMILNQCYIEDNQNKLRLAIWNKDINELIGTLLIQWNTENNAACEIGFSFGKIHWNKGYAQQTLHMIEDRLSQKGGCTITAFCMKDNLASISVFEKAMYSTVNQDEFPLSLLFIKVIS